MSNELYHAWLKKGESSDDHKYIRRYWKNGRWNYVYDDSIEFKSDTNSREHYTHDKHKTVLPKTWASYTNEWNGKFVKEFNDSMNSRNIHEEYADRFNTKYNPHAVTNYKDPSWLVKVKDKLGYDERYTYRKAGRLKDSNEDFARRSREKADRAYDTYTRLPNDYSYESYQLAENIAQATKTDAARTGELYIMAQERYFNTPLGKIEKARDDVYEWVDETISSITKRNKKRK